MNKEIQIPIISVTVQKKAVLEIKDDDEVFLNSNIFDSKELPLFQEVVNLITIRKNNQLEPTFAIRFKANNFKWEIIGGKPRATWKLKFIESFDKDNFKVKYFIDATSKKVPQYIIISSSI